MRISAVDDDPAIDVAIHVAMLLDNHGFIAPRLALANDGALMNPVTVVVGTAASDGDGGTHRADAHADAHILRTRRHAAKNSRHSNSGHCKTLDHRMLPRMLNFVKPMRDRR